MHELNSVSLSRLSPLSAPLPQKEGLHYVISSDVDHSGFAPWIENKYGEEMDEQALAQNQRALNSLAHHGVINATTGSAFLSMLQIKHALSGFKIDSFFTNNGTAAYLNHDGEEVETWLHEDTEMDPEWESLMKEKAGWDETVFFEVVDQVLANNGFVESSHDHDRPLGAYEHHKILNHVEQLAIFSVGESAIYLPYVLGETFNMNAAHRLGRQVSKQYQQQTGSEVVYKITMNDTYAYVFFSPRKEVEINKAVALQGYIDMLPATEKEPFFVLTIGDSGNDLHLFPDEFFVGDRGMPNVVVVSGKDSELLDHQEITRKEKDLFVAPRTGYVGNTVQKAYEHGMRSYGS